MRIALCLSGKAGNANKYVQGEETIDLAKIAFSHFKKNLLDINNVDVFMHSWDKQFKDELVEMYQPKGYIFQKQVQFGENYSLRQFCIKSKAYSNKRCLEVLGMYEKKYDFKYDAVILTRFDLAIQRPIVISEEGLDLNKFYHNGPDPLHIHSPESCVKVCCDPKSPHYAIGDLVFISNSENMKKFTELYDMVDSYNINSFHVSSRIHLEKLGLERDTFLFCNKSNFAGYNGIEDGDVALVRWVYNFGSNANENT
jgi:hypothetical protein